MKDLHLNHIGLPNIKLKLPSRNWLIFWTITGSFTSTLLYDRYHKNRAQQKWCNFVAHLADEPLPASTMPRKITIFLAAPPGDSIRAAREHFHEYVKPILVAGALDWDVIEGRKEGEVRAGLAEKIRRIRRRKGEKPQIENSEENPADESQEQLLYESRQRTGITEWNGVQGDLVLGRHTWKEYIRGLHEGWLGPLNPANPQQPLENVQLSDTPSSNFISRDMATSDTASESPPVTDPPAPDPSPAKPPKTSPTPPYITPSDYPSCGISPLAESSINPSLPLPLPHLLGFFNTPTRIYRFLTRRQMAESTGRSVAALVIASQTRLYNQPADFASAVDPDDASPTAGNSAEVESVVLSKKMWEQEAVLKEQEQEWHKSAWKANEEGDHRERVWQEPVVVDSRIGQRMSQFELASGEEEKAVQIDGQRRKEVTGWVEKARKWTGWTKTEKKGWDMGLEGYGSE